MDASREGGIIESLRRHLGRFAERTGLSVDLQAEAGNWKLRPEAAFGLARIVQEALTNAAKHAQGSAITVRLARNAGSLVCTVRDNGRGFAVGNAPVGVGLLTMRERAEALGGTLRIESAPDAGTTITVTLPM
jgi:signal transduction histidine kinase